MAESSRRMSDHDEIRSRAEERGAGPAAVPSTSGDGDVGVIRFDFPGYSGGESLEVVTWDEWFEEFESSELAVVLQDPDGDGEQSSSHRIVSRDE